MTFDEQIIHNLITHQIDLVRYERGVRRRVLRRLRVIHQSIVARLAEEDGSLTRQRLKRLLRDIEGILKQEYALLYDDMSHIQQQTEESERDWLAVYFASLGLTPRASGRLDVLIAGHTLKEALFKQRDDLNHRLKRAVRVGAVDGLAEMQSNVDDVLARQAQYAHALTATWIASIGNDALFQVAPADVQGWQHVSVLDSKTSAICTVRHGKRWNHEFKPMNHHLPFARPPLHPHCRSMLVPFTGFDDVLMSGDDWVKGRTLEQLQAQFGKGVGQLLHNGTINLSQAVKHGGLQGATLWEIQQAVLNKITVFDTVALSGAKFTHKKLRDKFKHADDFGLVTTKNNPQTQIQFRDKIIEHLNDKGTYQFGHYRDVANSKVFYNKRTGIAVAFDEDNIFITGFIPTDDRRLQLTHFSETGHLQ